MKKFRVELCCTYNYATEIEYDNDQDINILASRKIINHLHMVLQDRTRTQEFLEFELEIEIVNIAEIS